MDELILLCPSNGCPWEGLPQEVVSHYRDHHTDCLVEDIPQVIIDSNEGKLNRLLHLHRQLFLVQTHRKDNRLQVRLRTMEMTQQLTYRIRVSVLGRSGHVSMIDGGYAVDLEDLIGCCDLICIQFDIDSPTIQQAKRRPICIEMEEEARQLLDNHFEETKESEEPKESKQPCEEAPLIQFDDGVESLARPTVSTMLYPELVQQRFSVCDETYMGALICNGCFNNLLPPIFSCSSIHNFCVKCASANPVCPSCQQPIASNALLDEYSKLLEYPCKYIFQGCNQKVRQELLPDHEMTCAYAVYTCDLCGFEGKITGMRVHYGVVHPSKHVFEQLEAIPFQVGSEFVVISVMGVFRCHSIRLAKTQEWVVRFCGPKERRFECEVRLAGSKMEFKKRIVLERTDNYFLGAISLELFKSLRAKDKHTKLFIMAG